MMMDKDYFERMIDVQEDAHDPALEWADAITGGILVVAGTVAAVKGKTMRKRIWGATAAAIGGCGVFKSGFYIGIDYALKELKDRAPEPVNDYYRE